MGNSETPTNKGNVMPQKTVYADDILATDTIEMGGAEFFITDVIINNAVDGDVHLTMHPIGSENLKFYAYLPKHWPTTIRRK
jgi:hypothetical protein